MGNHPRDFFDSRALRETPVVVGRVKVLALFEEFQAGRKRGETVGNG